MRPVAEMLRLAAEHSGQLRREERGYAAGHVRPGPAGLRSPSGSTWAWRTWNWTEGRCGSGKGRAEKEVLSLPETTQEVIRVWLPVRGTEPGPLFLTLGPRRNRQRSGHRFTSRGIYRIVSELGEWAGTKVWPHGLRHSAITAAVEAAQEAGVSLDEVRQFSRHKNINTLLVYRDRVRDCRASWWRHWWLAQRTCDDSLSRRAAGCGAVGLACIIVVSGEKGGKPR